MAAEKTNRVLLWLNLLLLLIIGSAILTFIVMNRTHQGQINNSRIINSVDQLKEELELTDTQYEKVLVINDRTFRTYNIITDMMCENNVEMLEELSKDDFSAVKLDSLAKRYGTLSTSLRRHTIDYFKNISSICNEEQKKHLTLLFKKMMDLEEQCENCNKKDCPRKERVKNLGN